MRSMISYGPKRVPAERLMLPGLYTNLFLKDLSLLIQPAANIRCDRIRCFHWQSSRVSRISGATPHASCCDTYSKNCPSGCDGSYNRRRNANQDKEQQT